MRGGERDRERERWREREAKAGENGKIGERKQCVSVFRLFWRNSICVLNAVEDLRWRAGP